MHISVIELFLLSSLIFLIFGTLFSIGSFLAKRGLTTQQRICQVESYTRPLTAEEVKQAYRDEQLLEAVNLDSSPVAFPVVSTVSTQSNTSSQIEPAVEEPVDIPLAPLLTETQTFQLNNLPLSSNMTSTEQSSKYQADMTQHKTEGGADSHKRHREHEAKMEYDMSHIGVVGHDEETQKEAERLASESKRQKTENIPAYDSYTCNDSLYVALGRQKARGFTITGNAGQQPIWVANHSDKLVDVIKGLVDRNISAVPVLSKECKYYGFLDWMDLVRDVVRHFGPERVGVERTFDELLKQETNFGVRTVGEVMKFPLADQRLYHPLTENYSAMSVVEQLAREGGSRRVVIVDNTTNRHPVNLVTRSQVITWMVSHMQDLGTKRYKRVSQCAHFFREVVSCTENTVALDAFEMMVKHNIEGVAVLDDAGKLVGNVSLRDLKVIGSDASRFFRLTQTVKNFLVKVRAEVSRHHPHHKHRHAIFILPDASLEDVLMTFNRYKVHRLYVCSNRADRKVVGVISLNDLITEFLD